MEKKKPEDNSEKRYSIEETEANAEVNEPAVDNRKKLYSIAEYLEMERASDVKHEYYKGESFAMAGASESHNIISVNAIAELHNQLKNKSCRPYGSDMRVHIPDKTFFCYPDISIFCGDLITTDKEKDTALHPTIIIEIMSKSTRTYDRTAKFDLYREIPTLREYILIDSEQIRVICFRMSEHNRWVLEDYKTLQETVLIPTVGVSLSMEDIYNGISF